MARGCRISGGAIKTPQNGLRRWWHHSGHQKPLSSTPETVTCVVCQLHLSEAAKRRGRRERKEGSGRLWRAQRQSLPLNPPRSSPRGRERDPAPGTPACAPELQGDSGSDGSSPGDSWTSRGFPRNPLPGGPHFGGRHSTWGGVPENTDGWAPPQRAGFGRPGWA